MFHNMPNQQEFKKLQEQVAELMKWKKDKIAQQLTYPIDYKSMRALNEAFRTNLFTEIHVRDVFFIPTEENPTIEGQMRYFNDLATQSFRCTTTEDVFTGTIDLTAS